MYKYKPVTIEYISGNTESYISAMALIYAFRLWYSDGDDDFDPIRSLDFTTASISDDFKPNEKYLSRGNLATLRIPSGDGDEIWNAVRTFDTRDLTWKSTVELHEIDGKTETTLTTETEPGELPRLSMPHVIWLAAKELGDGDVGYGMGVDPVYPSLPAIIRMADCYHQEKCGFIHKVPKRYKKCMKVFKQMIPPIRGYLPFDIMTQILFKSDSPRDLETSIRDTLEYEEDPNHE